mgnify:CR=1 FL=1
MVEVPRRTSMDELLEKIFEQFSMSGLVADARIGRVCTGRLRISRGSVTTYCARAIIDELSPCNCKLYA